MTINSRHLFSIVFALFAVALIVAPANAQYWGATTAYYAPSTSYYAPYTSYYSPYTSYYRPYTSYYSPYTSYYGGGYSSYYAPRYSTYYAGGWYPGYWMDRARVRLWGSPATYVAAYPATYTAGYAGYATSYAPACSSCSSCSAGYAPCSSCSTCARLAAHVQVAALRTHRADVNRADVPHVDRVQDVRVARPRLRFKHLMMRHRPDGCASCGAGSAGRSIIGTDRCESAHHRGHPTESRARSGSPPNARRQPADPAAKHLSASG